MRPYDRPEEKKQFEHQLQQASPLEQIAQTVAVGKATDFCDTIYKCDYASTDCFRKKAQGCGYYQG